MVEEEVIRFKQAYLQNKIDNMRNYVKEYEKSVDKCNPAGISSAAIFIGELGEFLKSEKQYLNRKQEDEIDDLKREYAIKFQKLNLNNICECKPKAKK
jgi:hypothetical protein